MKKGITLIEFLIYIVILGTVLTIAGAIAFNIFFSKSKLEAVVEVSQNARFSLEKIALAVRNAKAITSPAIGQSSSVLTLQMPGVEGGTTVDLVGHWKLDDGTGSPTAADSSGRGNIGTLQPLGNEPVWTSAGQIGGALDFDGTDDYVDMGTPSVLAFERTVPFSISVWVRRDRNSTDERFLQKQFSASPHKGYRISFTADDTLIFLLSGDSWGYASYLNIYTTTTYGAIGEWYHIVATYNGSSDVSGAKLYVNGALAPTSPGYNTLTTSIVNNTTSLTVGMRKPADRPFDGLIDDVRIYNSVLSAPEIQDLYNAGINPIVFDLSGGVLRQDLYDAGIGAINLTSSEVTVTDLRFTNVSYPGSPGAVRIEMTVEAADPARRRQYTYTKTFYTTANIREK